jgi:monofunctional biosynthetic peptidoglycan transglycosylase
MALISECIYIFLYLSKIIVLASIMQTKRKRKTTLRCKYLKNKFLYIIKFLFIYLPGAFLIISLLWITTLKWAPVYITPLMIIRSVENRGDKNFKTTKRWVPLEKISSNMVMAVIASEDNRFNEHRGFDWVEIDRAIDESKRKGRRLRGASTISQQTAKNVFLIPSRSWIRKGFEVYFTAGIELIWGKRRVMEVYLNVAEMGRGIYGAEAAAGVMFNKTAQKLTTRESALIAASLPNPLRRRADRPSPYHNSRATDIQDLMRKLPVPEWINKGR